MSAIQICGGRPLKGRIRIQGSKNAVLPMMAASILHEGTTVIENVPRIQDVSCMMGILEYIGCDCRMDGNTLTVQAEGKLKSYVPETFVCQMRSSVILLGALLGRTGRASISYPGGCSIGKRPIDLHLAALKQLGAVICEDGKRIEAFSRGLCGGKIDLAFPSVGATENALLGAVRAKGTTVINGAAKEPEIAAFCRFLSGMGANIRGTGTGCLMIEGTGRFHDSVFSASGDRIVAGTYLMAAMAAGGELWADGVDPKELSAVEQVLKAAGGEVGEAENSIFVRMSGRPKPVTVDTGPYPGFPTDLQSPLLALMAGADGKSRIVENIFEGRYETAAQLKKMGADISVEGKTAIINGREKLYGTEVEATDLRGGAALAAAALAADGVTVIRKCRHIERGYEDICRDLREAGADIRWTDD
ncbi:MAG TPA: UDP-N-acetylglucosamine 1-carboxyvinyltransferase [Candidatus Lachnoclostridium stercoravium]|uniref:UDP-N-acetylglucosamine 1-carboxyvinyltransferase n=1 Tax=Candidatus Lachnoclostridium stercoravium TaxID=2838633 RepID=A0A9D2KLY2_9FIRM|nr:UDP-N-acetylglucosamine 1-carboxyvinyltransferase [Candidatus Lachnoclostridium stercoravium]